MTNVQPKSIIVIFGATGDLAKRKLFPLFSAYIKRTNYRKISLLLVSQEDLGLMTNYAKM